MIYINADDEISTPAQQIGREGKKYKFSHTIGRYNAIINTLFSTFSKLQLVIIVHTILATDMVINGRTNNRLKISPECRFSETETKTTTFRLVYWYGHSPLKDATSFVNQNSFHYRTIYIAL